ncbi:MAG: HD domain-containing protein [Candidatus Paceibacterota bacterium]|jgi:putative hydrolase of HD superfamily
MRTKNSNPGQFTLGKNLDPILCLYFQANHLKQLYRQGWIRAGRDVPESQCESVADHNFGMSLLSLFVCDLYFPHLDRMKVVSMCLVHELGEIANGDPPPAKDQALQMKKVEMERQSITLLLRDLPGGDRYLSLWEEFERNETPEARLVKELDKFEMAIQAKIYSLQHGKDLQEFISYVRSCLDSKELIRLLNQIESM